MLTTQIAILILLIVACLSAVVFRRLNFPYTVGLVIVGFGLGYLEEIGISFRPLKDLVLSPDLILFIFVPPLIFESALNLDNRLLQRNLGPILMLAIPGLVVSMLIIGGSLAWLTPLSLGSAMVFGALISATDPVAVIALFKELGVSKRLNMLVEGESMLNDAAAIVAFEVVLFIVTSGVFEASTPGEIVVRVFVVLVGGVAVGWVMGVLLGYSSVLVKDDILVGSTISLVGAYLTFIIAEHYLSVSGVVAVMTAGLIAGRYFSRRHAPKARAAFHGFWDFAAFLANSLIFMLVGLNTAGFIEELSGSDPLGLWEIIGLAIVVAVVARGVMVFTLLPACNPFLRDGPIDWRNRTVIFWGGLRGAVALALALSLSNDFADRNLLIAITLGVALFTIIGGGTTIGMIIHRLRLDEPDIIDQLADAEAVFLARCRALEVIEDMKEQEPLLPDTVPMLKKQYQTALDEAEAALSEIWATLAETPELGRRALWLQALALEQRSYQRIFHEQGLSEPVLDKLHLAVELRRDAVLTDQIPPPAELYESLEMDWEKLLSGALAQPIMSETRQATDKLIKEQRREQSFQGQYEYDLAVATAAEHVARQIDELVEQHAVDATMAEECARVYRQARSQALQRLRTLLAEHPNRVSELQRRLVHSKAMTSAGGLLQSLVAQGIVTSANAEKALEQLHRE